MEDRMSETPVSGIEVREVGAEANRFEIKPVSLQQAEDEISREPTPRISAIIAAYNEQDTIVDVIRSVEGHPIIQEIIVVDDGSTDATVERARTTSANVISMEKNSGKAAAMSRGVKAARNETILFLDADILGLTHQMITLCVT